LQAAEDGPQKSILCRVNSLLAQFYIAIDSVSHKPFEKNKSMSQNQKNLAPLFFAVVLFVTTTILLLTDKKPRYDEYDRLMW